MAKMHSALGTECDDDMTAATAGWYIEGLDS